VAYRVRPGDTATGLAVRFHAWTDELRALNHLGRHGTLYVGERIRIPVVPKALRPHHRVHHRAHHAARHTARHHTARHPRPAPAHHPVVRATPRRPWALAGASRGKVRRVVMRIAAEHHLGSRLALAVAWQESGWQQHRVSSAGAIGVMQVLPGTARWMSSYVGRPLNPYGLYDNVTAGVVLLTVLRSQTAPTKAIGAYFQGLGSVQRHGLQRSTKAYVRSVLALRRRIAHGWNPA
jgi:LysM repeat protein